MGKWLVVECMLYTVLHLMKLLIWLDVAYDLPLNKWVISLIMGSVIYITLL